MKATPYLEQVFHLIIQLLNDQGHEEIAERLAEIYQLPEWIETNNPLLKKGLTKIIKDYVKNNEKLLKYYQNIIESQQEQQTNKKTRKRSVDSHRKSASPKAEVAVRTHIKKAESPLVSKVASPKQASSPKQAGKASSWMSKFQKPKTLEELNEVTETVQEVLKEEAPNHSKPKKNKKKKIESSEYESQQDSFELEPKKKLKKQAKEEKKVEKQKKKHVKQVSEESEMEEQKVVPPKKQEKKVVKAPIQMQQKKPYENGAEINGYPKKIFSRINPDDVGPIREELRDNSFQAKAKFGQQADHWGQFGYEKLKDTRGDSFKKTKGKLKNRAFQGALMDINKINSIPIA